MKELWTRWISHHYSLFLVFVCIAVVCCWIFCSYLFIGEMYQCLLPVVFLMTRPFLSPKASLSNLNLYYRFSESKMIRKRLLLYAIELCQSKVSDSNLLQGAIHQLVQFSRPECGFLGVCHCFTMHSSRSLLLRFGKNRSHQPSNSKNSLCSDSAELFVWSDILKLLNPSLCYPKLCLPLSSHVWQLVGAVQAQLWCQATVSIHILLYCRKKYVWKNECELDSRLV